MTYAPEFKYPGLIPDTGDPNSDFHLRNYLLSVELELNEAAVALQFFVKVRRGERLGDESLPGPMEERAQFLFARAFMNAVYNVRKLLAVIRTLPIDSKKVKQAIRGFDSKIPDLKGVRDSSEHLEDRVRGRSGSEALRPGPVSSQLVDAPGGGVLFIDSLDGDTFIATMKNGGLGRLPITESTLRKVVTAVQAVIDAYRWSGSPRATP